MSLIALPDRTPVNRMDANHVRRWYGKERLRGLLRFSLSAPSASAGPLIDFHGFVANRCLFFILLIGSSQSLR